MVLEASCSVVTLLTSIEVFPELHGSWSTRDLSTMHLINADFVATRNFYFD